MSENNKFLEGCEKLADGRYRIREKIYAKVIPSNKKITDKIILEGKEYSPTKSFTFLIWKKDKVDGDGSGVNGNLRNYSRIIPRCIKENRVTWTLADHPEDGTEADSLRICGVARNPHMIGDWLGIEWIPLNEIGETLAKGYELGAPACLSSSCLGSVSDDGYIINDDTFFLERWCDHLQVQPSNALFQYVTDGHVDIINDDYSFDTISETINESVTKETSTTENLTISNKETSIVESSEKPQNDKADEIENNETGEDKMPENTMNEELVQESMKLNIMSMIKDACKLDNPFERKESLISADCFAKKLTESSLHDEISKKIEDADNEIKELSTKGLQTDDLAEKCKALEDEIAKANSELEILKKEKAEVDEKLKTLTAMYDEEQFKASDAECKKSAELEERNHNLSKEICSLKAKNRNLESIMKKNSRALEAKVRYAEAEANTGVDVETFLKCKNKCKALEDENAELTGKVEELEDTIATLKKNAEAVDVENGAEEIITLKTKLDEMIRKNNRLRKLLNESRLAKMEKKESRFAQLKKTIEEDDDEEIVSDEDVENDDIVNSDVTVTDNGEINVTDTDDEIDEDEIMEKMLRGEIK